MDDLWHLKTCQGLNINYSQSSAGSTSMNQIETLPGSCGYPFVQQEVCVIERTVRQQANLLNRGLQGPIVKSNRGDVGNSLLALVPGSPQHRILSNCQSVRTPQTPLLSPNPQGYQLASVNPPCIGSWPLHLLNMPAGNRLGGGNSGVVVDSSINTPEREVTLSMLGREVNWTQYSRMTGGQDRSESSPASTSGVEMSKHNDTVNDISGQGPYPPWLTEIISSRQRGQNIQSPTFASAAGFPRAVESSRDSSSVMSSLTALGPTLVREARVVCINYDTGQRFGGELYLTQLGLLGVICSCHGSHMSVAKFTQHVGIYSTNPGNVIAMDGTGESLVQWRKALFSQYGIKVPYDNQGWNWSDGTVSECGPTKYKAVVTQSWQKEVDVSCSGEPFVKSRLTQVWDASVSPSSAVNYPMTQNSATLGLSSNLGEGCVRDSKETFLKSIERALRGNSLEFGSYPSVVEDMGENIGRSPGLPGMQPCKSSSTEFINFISGSQQLVAGNSEQQLAVEHQIAVGRRSLLKGLDLTWTERREPMQHENDNSLSSFELKLGQPSQQSQPVSPPASNAADQMQKVMRRGEQHNNLNTSATTAAGLLTFSGCEGPSDNRLFNQPRFENATYVEPNHHSACPVDPNRGIEGNGSVLVDHFSFKGTENVSTLGIVEKLRESENSPNRNADQFSPGMRRWSSVGCVGSSFKLPDAPGLNSKHPVKRWAEEAQLHVGREGRSMSRSHQDLDSVLGQEWMSRSRPSENQARESSGCMPGRGGQANCGESMMPIQRECTPPSRGVCTDDKDQLAYGAMITSRGTREGQGCVYLNTVNATTMKGRILSKLGEDQDVCMKEANQEGNHAESDRHGVNRDGSQGPIAEDCSSPSGCRLRSFQAVTNQACSCSSKLVGERSSQGGMAKSLTGNEHAPTYVAETDVVMDKKFINQEGLVANSGSLESNHDTFHWKEMSGIFVPGNSSIPDPPQDDISSPRSLAEDLLADTVGNVNSRIAVNSKVSNKQQAISDLCSKSSENAMSAFSDGAGAEEEVSNGHSVQKNTVGSGLADEASTIGKCSSSAGVDVALLPNSISSLNGKRTPKKGTPSSQGCSSLCNGTECSRTTVETKSRGGYDGEGLTARDLVEDTRIDTGKVGKKRKRTMKWKWLDAAIGTADTKRRRWISSVNVAENFDASQKLMEETDISNCLGDKNNVGVSPSLCGEDSATNVHAQGNRPALNAELGMDVNAVNSTDQLRTDESYLRKTETMVIRAKRSGRSKTCKKKAVVPAEDEMTCSKSAFSEIVTVNPSPMGCSIIKEQVGTGGCITELTGSAAKSLLKDCSTLHTKSGKSGQVVLRRPSPRNAIRMVSLNDIMNKPEVVASITLKDHKRASVVKDDLDLLPNRNGCRVPCVKEHPKACALKNGMKACAVKDGLEAFSGDDSVKTSATTEGLNSLPARGTKVSDPKEALEMSSMEGFKVRLYSSKDDFKTRSAKGELKANPGEDVQKVFSAKHGQKIPYLKNGLKALSGKNGSKTATSDDNWKVSSPKRGLKVSGVAPSPLKDDLEESTPKSVSKMPVTMDDVEVLPLKGCSKVATAKNRPMTTVPKVSKHLPAELCPKLSSCKEGWEPSGPKNGVKTVTLRDRLKTLASRNALQDSFSFDMDIGSAPRNATNASVLKDNSKTLVPIASFQVPSKEERECKSSGILVAAERHADQDKLSSHLGNSWMESRNTTKSNRQEVRKVRSLYELISEKNVPGPGTGVFEFHDEDMESSGIVKHDSVSRPIVQLDSGVSVPVHFADSKCLVPRGERSPRGKPAKVNSNFLRRHKSGSIGDGKLAAEPVEIVVSRGSVKDTRFNGGSSMTIEEEVLTEIRLCPVTPRICSPQNNRTKREVNDGPSSGLASSPTRVKELLGKGLVNYNRAPSQKRIAEPDIMGNALKRQKIVESPRIFQSRSGCQKTRDPFPLSRPTTPTIPAVDVVGLDVKDNKVRSPTVDADLNIPGRKKRSERQKAADCQAPEGVVECCVCGSSISEFFNQIVCCSRCPVKVHQACYGVKKVPNNAWCCRTCKATAANPICVLCGYGGGAMTRAQKTVGFVKGLVKVWREKINARDKTLVGLPHSVEFQEIDMHVAHSLADHQHLLQTNELSSCSDRGKDATELSELNSRYLGCTRRLEKPVPKENLGPCNTVSLGLLDSTMVQWVHMVCALWMPGTRCLNFGTMGVFDVSGVSQSRRKLVCSICNRKGGACVQCRVLKCGIPFHPWCAHEKGLLQSEIVDDGSDQVGFYGKCLRHGQGGDVLNDNPDFTAKVPDELGLLNVTSDSCARTEGYAGKLTLEQRAVRRRQAKSSGSAAVSPEQIAAWLRINERKTCKEYLRFKQEQGWRRLSVYKSGIHALGLYTAEFIGRGEMVVEYIGEIVGLRVADKREADYHAGKRMQYQGACYLFRIDKERIIDATRKGGIARFVNHSCSPNCVAKVICVKNQSKVVFFAQRDIYAGEEITYDYQFNFEQEGDKIPCFCGSLNCRGTLN